MNKKTIIMISASALIIILLIAGYFYWSYQKNKNPNYNTDYLTNGAEDITNSATKGILPSFQTNPLETKPDINPADKANPFTNIKTNPF